MEKPETLLKPEHVAALNREQLQMFMQINKGSAIGLIVVATWALWNELPHAYLLPWMGTILIFMGIRNMMVPKSIEGMPDAKMEQKVSLIWKFTIGGCFAWGFGVAGSLGFLSLEKQFLLVVLLLGISGSIMGYSTERKYSVLMQMMLVPVVLALFYFGQTTQVELALLLILYVVFMQSSLRNQHDRFARTVLARFKNDELLAQLHEQIAQKDVVEKKLREKSADAELANRAKSQFLSVVSHELRTPVHGIIGMLDLVVEEPMPQEVRDDVVLARQAAATLQKLVNDVLDLSKAETGHLDLSPVCFDLRHCMHEVLLCSAQDAAANHVTVIIEYVDVPCLVTADKSKLQQILRNLVENAVQHTTDGLVQIEVRAIIATNVAAKQSLGIKICDTGVGIAEQDLDHVFDPFVQLGAVINRHQGGSGLGTSIAKKLVECMGGDIHVESVLGQGAQFIFSVQCVLEGEPVSMVQDVNTLLTKLVQHEKPLEKKRVYDSSLTVLLAEDDETSRFSLTKHLQVSGLTVIEAEDGAKAWLLAQHQHVDLIILDLRMPEMDGLEVIRRIRGVENPNRSTPVIGLSAHASEDVVQTCLSQGMNAFLVKPVEANEIINKTHEFLGGA